MSDAFTSKLTEGLTGALPDAVMYRYIGGASQQCGRVVFIAQKMNMTGLPTVEC